MQNISTTPAELRKLGRSIVTLWLCGNDEDCTNKIEPGKHEEWADAEKCVAQHQPAKWKKYKQ